ncbi:MAG: N-acetylmuramoyl-L-alanine amidase [Verrucomicrobiota bacterium]|nr:N-acetylmuramoyl-L-alanine amidase [Verrucomicrobiota bacterium]
MKWIADCGRMSLAFWLRISAFTWALALGAPCLRASAANTISFNGQTYVPVASWAHTHDLMCHWVKRGDLFEAANGTARLIFNVDSHYADINGVQVALSFPVADQKGAACVARFDLDKTIQPLLFPPRSADPQRLQTICLDPGHGGRDTGNRVRWHNEKTYTLWLALDLRDELRKAGFKVVLTRTRDEYVDLASRAALANSRGADLFVSLHFNATVNGRDEVQGPETYCITPVGASSTNARGKGADRGPAPGNRHQTQSLLLAYQVEKSLVDSLHLDDRGVRRARFEVLRDTRMPAILVEAGYMTNPEESQKIYTLAYRRSLARAIAAGIMAYKNLTSPAISTTTPPARKISKVRQKR